MKKPTISIEAEKYGRTVTGVLKFKGASYDSDGLVFEKAESLATLFIAGLAQWGCTKIKVDVK